MLRLAAGSCSREIRPLLLAFQLHFTALHICCSSYFSAFSPQANTALLWLHWLSLTAQPSLPSFFFFCPTYSDCPSPFLHSPHCFICLPCLSHGGELDWTDDGDAHTEKKNVELNQSWNNNQIFQQANMMHVRHDMNRTRYKEWMRGFWNRDKYVVI